MSVRSMSTPGVCLLLLILAASIVNSEILHVRRQPLSVTVSRNQKVELGRALFFDKRLSEDGTVSCATCHDPASAFASGDAVAEAYES